MNLSEIKTIFQKELKSLFPKTEIDSFFYLLTEEFIGLKRIDIALNPNKKIDSEIENNFNSALGKLKKEIPIQYIIGETEFYGLPFYVDKNVLIPRPETEEIVAWIINEIQEKRKDDKDLNILDIGTGSGCIAISLAKNILNSKVWALDISEKALKNAKKNAKLNGVTIQFLNNDILNLDELPIKFDIIVSNPPYVRELEKKQMQDNVLKHEPHLALFVKDENALIFYSKIADIANNYLNSKGKIFFEINQEFGKESINLLKEKGFKNIELRKDIFDVDRMIMGEKN